MVALKTERRIFMWRVTPRTVPAKGPPAVNLDTILNLLEAAYVAKAARCYLTGSRLLDESKGEEPDEKNQIYIADMKRNPKDKTITLLINRGDPNAVSPALLDAEQNTVTVVQPKGKQTPGWSAHLVIALQPDQHGRHKACFEKMPHVSSALALSAMDAIIARMVMNDAAYTYKERPKKGEKGEPKTRAYRPALATARVPSEKLKDDLAKGELVGVTLTKKVISYSGPLAKEMVTHQEEKCIIRTASADQTKVEKFVRGVVDWGKSQSYEGITFDLDSLPGGMSNKPTIPLDDHDALEQLYVRAQPISGFKTLLEACYPAICTEIEGKMIEIIASDHGW